MADDWISEVNAHSDTDCWCRGTHAEGLHSIWERRRDADQLRAENTALRARLAEVEAERDELRDEIGNLTMHDAAVEWRKAEAALARVEALCDQWDDLPNHVRRDIDAFDVICEVRAALRGPQDERHEFRPDDPVHRGSRDEEAAEVCGANGCSNRATGMRKSYVPGWPDVPDCGMHTQRSGAARPDHPRDTCTDQCETDWHTAECAAGRTTQPEEDHDAR
jgi:hypothetical protein